MLSHLTFPISSTEGTFDLPQGCERSPETTLTATPTKGKGRIPKTTTRLSTRQLLLPICRQRLWLPMGEEKRQGGGGGGSPSPTLLVPFLMDPLLLRVSYAVIYSCASRSCQHRGLSTHGGWFSTSILLRVCLLVGQNWSHQPGQQGAGGCWCVARHRVQTLAIY